MINLLFCGSKNVFPGILTAVLSMLEFSEKDEVHVSVFTMDKTDLDPRFTPISDAQIALLDRVLKESHPSSSARLVDVKEIYEKELGGCPNESAYCTPYTLVRLLADLVEGMPDKFLYLDCDLMFHRDVHLLYDIDISNYEYGGAPDQYGKWLLLHRPFYLNAGVLLFNLAYCKKSGLFEKARGLLRKKKYLFADQTAIIKSTKRRKYLRQRFNDQRRITKNTVIRHFAKRMLWLPYPHVVNIKQWDVDKVHSVYHYHQFDAVYARYESLKEELDL